MINLDSIASGMISGVNQEELQFLTDLSFSSAGDNRINQWTGLRENEERVLQNLMSNDDVDLDLYIPELEESDLFFDLDETTVNSLNEMEIEEVPRSTKSHTKAYAQKFKSFLVSKQLPDCIETMPLRYLNQYLRLFYASLRKDDGNYYSPSTLACIRAAINRYLTKAPHNREINLKKDREFGPSNNILKAMSSKYLKSPQSSNDNSYKAISQADLVTLREYFDRRTATKLQEEVLYNIVYYNGYRGREWIRNMKTCYLKFDEDENNYKYAMLDIPAFSKNNKGSLDENEYSNNKQTRIYAQPEAESTCPVKAIQMYLSKIPPEVNILFPAVSRKWNFSDQFWYSKREVKGKNKLGSMMTDISKAAKLSMVYTNHCIRATCVTQLFNKGFSVSDIQKVTGHKRPDSVQRYIKNISSEKKRKVSNALSESMNQQQQHAENAIIEQTNASISVNRSNSASDNFFSNCLFSNCTINIKQ